MQKNQVAVLDVGSSKITCLIGERGVNNTFVIKGFSEKEYSGFSDGTFFDTAELNDVVSKLVYEVAAAARTVISSVYVGVPGEFTTVILKEHQIAFNKKRHIKDTDIDALYEAAYTVRTQKYRLINRCAVYYTLDDYRRVLSPIREISSTLRGKLSFILCQTDFVALFDSILKGVGVKEIEYVSSSLAEAMYLFEPEKRDRTVVLADIGYLTTSFSIIQGDGIVYQKAFSYGGGHITANLTEVLDIDFSVAEKLKRKVNLGFASGEFQKYTIIDGDKEYTFPADKVNEIVTYSLDELCENISQCIGGYNGELPDYVSLYVTGGGVTFIRGHRERIASRLNIVIEDIAPDLPYMNKPTQSSYLALLDIALKQK